MARLANHPRHGSNHSPGGSDPIPGIGDTTKQVLAVWGGALPIATGNGQVWTVPNDTNGDPHTFTLARAYARIEDLGAEDIVFRIEKSPGGGVFTATTVTTLTIAAGDYDVTDTTFSVSITSGNLVRIVFVDVGDLAGETIYHVELLGSE